MNGHRHKLLRRLLCLLVLALPIGTAPVYAEPAKGGGDAAVLQTLRKAQGMLRQLAQEKADLEAKTTGLEAQVKTLETRVKELEPLTTEVQTLKAANPSLVLQSSYTPDAITGLLRAVAWPVPAPLL